VGGGDIKVDFVSKRGFLCGLELEYGHESGK
jgi:hypothetical protein